MLFGNLTTPQLRQNAKRRLIEVIESAQTMSRTQLIEATRTTIRASIPNGLLHRVVGLAKWVLSTTGTHVNANTLLRSQPPMQDQDTMPLPPMARADASVETQTRSRTTQNTVTASNETTSCMPTGVFSATISSESELFPTKTMARILANQGHYKRSWAIYTILLRHTPEDIDLRKEAELVRLAVQK